MNKTVANPEDAAARSEALLTIVVPVYNRAAKVVRTLDSIAASVAAQPIPRQVRMVVVDNASTDESMDAVRRWAAAQTHGLLSVEVINESTPGAAAARNAGLRRATTPWVMHFDSDDLMHVELMGLVHKAIGALPQARLLGWPVSYRMPSGRVKTGIFTTRRAVVNHLYHATLATLRYAVRRDVLTALSADGAPWDEDMRVWDDYVLGCRILMLRPAMTRISTRPMADVEVGEESISGTGFSTKQGMWEAALDRCGEILPPRYHKHLTARRAILAGLYVRENPGRVQKPPYRLIDVLPQCKGLWHRLVCRLVYTVARHGLPGPGRLAALLLHP